MMPELRIARVRKSYCVPASASGDVSRFDRVFASAVRDELLDAALERAGIPTSDEVCIRRVDSVVQLDRSDPDSRLAATWSIALADAVANRLREGGPDVVRYPSRFAALVEMICDAARGCLERAWAWRSLGIWRAGDALDVATACGEAAAELSRYAPVAPAVLAVAARRGVLPLLISRLPAERWIRLAQAALAACSASEATPTGRWLGDEPIERAAHGATSERYAAAIPRIERRSAIVRAVRTTSGALSIGQPATSRALALLAILECEPALVASPYGPAIANELAQRLVNPAIESAVSTPSRPRVEPRRSTSTARVARNHDGGISDRASRDDRACGTTAFGGVLFLQHLVRALDLPSSLVAEPVLAGRSLSWTLYRLALLLAPVSENDPAALAFAGLPPFAPAPVVNEPSSSDEEDAALREARDAIVSALRARMLPAAEETDHELVARVTSRRADIVADPGWIEVRLAVADVNTDVRRAGLDLDPGWLPWLGLVVRFAYA
jgi:hypothetical protein